MVITFLIVVIIFVLLFLFIKTKNMIITILLSLLISAISFYPIFIGENFIYKIIQINKINKQINLANEMFEDINYQLSIYPKKYKTTKYIINNQWFINKIPVKYEQQKFLNKYGKGDTSYNKNKFIEVLVDVIKKQNQLLNSVYSNKYTRVEDKNKIKQKINIIIYKK